MSKRYKTPESKIKDDIDFYVKEKLKWQKQKEEEEEKAIAPLPSETPLPSRPESTAVKKLFFGRCKVPKIPMWGGKRPVEYTTSWKSLMEAEDALDKSMYPLSHAVSEEVKRLCGAEKTVRDKVECAGKWVEKSVEYDANHSYLSQKASEVIETNSKNEGTQRENKAYPMHRYMVSQEACDAMRGICGENSQVLVGLLREMRVISALYRPFMGHLQAIAEDPQKREFYIFDATNSKDSCVFYGNPKRPASVVTKRWAPDSSYTVGVTPKDAFYEWNIDRRKALGTTKACQLVAGIHDINGARKGFWVDERGKFDEVKAIALGYESDLEKIKTTFNECGKYLDKLYETSKYHDVSVDTENTLLTPPSEEVNGLFSGREIIDLEHADECEKMPNDTALGRFVTEGLNDECKAMTEWRSVVDRIFKNKHHKEVNWSAFSEIKSKNLASWLKNKTSSEAR